MERMGFMALQGMTDTKEEWYGIVLLYGSPDNSGKGF